MHLKISFAVAQPNDRHGPYYQEEWPFLSVM